MTAALEVDGLASGYGTSQVVSDISFALAKSEVLAIVGRNGMGKTSLLKTVLGFLPAWRGTIMLCGQDVTRVPPHLKRRRGLVYVPQEKALFQDLSIRDNLRLGILSDRDFDTSLDQVGQWFPVLTQRLHQRAGTLSGGEQKMLIVARALMARPEVLVARRSHRRPAAVSGRSSVERADAGPERDRHVYGGDRAAPAVCARYRQPLSRV